MVADAPSSHLSNETFQNQSTGLISQSLARGFAVVSWDCMGERKFFLEMMDLSVSFLLKTKQKYIKSPSSKGCC
jgi:hypothetical protein